MEFWKQRAQCRREVGKAQKSLREKCSLNTWKSFEVFNTCVQTLKTFTKKYMEH